MTTQRIDIVIEGSDDGANRKQYLFSQKPSARNRRPRRISPIQPRLDWQAWFLPFSDYGTESWLHNFLFHLLKGTPDVLSLLRHSPFPDKPPKYIRAVAYDYTFTDWETKKKTGNWWDRKYLGQFSPILSLREET